MPDSDGRGYGVGIGRMLPALVITHSCEIDKVGMNRVLVVPVSPLSNLREQERVAVLAQDRFAFFPMAQMPNGWADSYADLRSMTFVDIRNVKEAKRVASLSDVGIVRLWAQIIGFFSDREIKDIFPAKGV